MNTKTIILFSLMCIFLLSCSEVGIKYLISGNVARINLTADSTKYEVIIVKKDFRTPILPFFIVDKYPIKGSQKQIVEIKGEPTPYINSLFRDTTLIIRSCIQTEEQVYLREIVQTHHQANMYVERTSL